MILQALLAKYALKGGVVLAFLSIIFYAGCYTQKQIDASKILKLKDKITHYSDVIDVLEENNYELRDAIEDQNAAITELGEETVRRTASLQAAHDAAIDRLNAANSATIRAARDEAAELRERMAGLSAAEACHEAWLEVVR
jgi:uncharacterized protein YabE (DUF348 family)